MDDRPSEFVDLTIVTRSKSSDLLKIDSPSSGDSVKATNRSSHFNSLKQWGRNRLRLMRDSRDKVQDIDDFNISETTKNQRKKSSEKDRKLSHERKPSYSSSEKSLSLATNMPSNVPASINPVKLRESSSIRRQRRTALGNRDEPHSSSGNWSASSESGRTSIGSEITTTTHPKSSASSTSLNHNNGPPSSIISRRRFLNTSASSSVTSEGTATPDLQFNDYHDEGGETSSVYSCDTEGYYTSFHVDSGLKTLKEEEPTTPLHSTTALSSTTSFESSGNQTVISPENEYELFGRGSTSTTTSSAGTICTVLADNDRNSSVIGPAVPERKSSLTKLNRSNSNASSGTLERSYSSSTVGSTLERTGTIKRNGILLQKEVAALIHNEEMNKNERIESPDSGNNTSSSPVESNANSSPTQGVRSYSEFEYSESSDLECVDRIERIRIKTTINTSRIPSMCIITPTNSDDERESSFTKEKPKKPESLKIKDMFGKLKGVLKKSPNKEEPIYDATGDYVTISDVRNNNGNDILRKNLATVLSGNLNEETEYVSLNELPCNIRCESNLLSNSINEKEKGENQKDDEKKKMDKKGARVKLDAQGKVIYSSDSLKRRKGAHTTFAPGPFVKDNNNTASSVDVNVHSISSDVQKIASPLLSGGVANRKALNVRPVVSQIKTPTINSPAGQIKDQAMSGVLKGAYVNVQTTTTSSSSSTAIMQGKPQSTNTPPNKPRVIGYSPKVVQARKSLRSPYSFKTKIPQPQNQRVNENNDPNNCSKIVKRSNSYRMANSPILSLKYDDSKIDEKENILDELKPKYLVGKIDNLSPPSSNSNTELLMKLAQCNDEDDEHDDGYDEKDFDDTSRYLNISKAVTRSFERLLNEISKSDSQINDEDDDEDFWPSKLKLNLNNTVSFPLSPSKVTIPSDGGMHRARVLSFSSCNHDNSTEIW